MPEKSPDNSESISKGQPNLSFSVDFSIFSDRRIRGRAHFEQKDLENEIILIDAIKKALDQFMEHPILHYQHTERPIGTITKAEIKDKGLWIEASIYDTPDTDDVWAEIQRGSLNKFSIYGRRLQGNDQCRISPENRMSPCVTKAIALWSISAVGDNAINQMTFLEVIKSLRGDTVTDEVTEEIVQKADEESPQSEETLLKSETNTSSILERLAGVEQTLQSLVDSDKQVHESMGETAKAEEVEEPGEDEEKKCGCAAKAEPVETDTSEEIVKGDVIQKAFDEFRKAYDEKIAALESRIATMEEETVKKGGSVVIIPEQLSPEDARIVNPMILNAKALGA